MRLKCSMILLLSVSTLLAGCGEKNDSPESTDISSNVRSESQTLTPEVMDSDLGEAPYPRASRVYEAGVNNFEAWSLSAGASVVDAAAEAPDGSVTADLLRLDNNSVAGWRRLDMMIEPGDSVEASVWLWANGDTRVVLQLVRWCSDTQPEVATEIVSATSSPQRYWVSHTFEFAHECVRFQIKGGGQSTAVYAWNASVDREN